MRRSIDSRSRRRGAMVGIVVIVLAAQVVGFIPEGATPHAAAAPRDVTVAPDVAAAAEAAQNEGHRVEVSELDEIASTTYVNPDGTRTTEAFANPIRTEQDGALVPVDTTLTRSASGALQPGATDLAVTLSGGGDSTLATVGLGDGSLTYGWPSPLPTPSVTSNTATYPDVLPDIDLVVTVNDLTVETSYVVKAKPLDGRASVAMPVTLTGVTAQVGADGGVTYRDADSNQAIGRGAPATSWDSSVNPATDAPVTVSTPSTLITDAGSVLPPPDQQPDDNTLVQQVQLPSALLADPATVFPVVVDPELAGPVAESAYTFVNSGHSTTSYYDTSEDASRVHMGLDPEDSGSLNRPMWLFGGMTPLANPNTNVLSATFSAGLSWTSSCSPQPVDLYTTGPWNSATTWASQPAAAGPYTSATPPSANTRTCGSGHAESTVGFTVTNLIQSQKNYGRTDLSIQLRAHDEGNSAQWQKWHWQATLSYTYVATPNAVANPTFTSPSMPCSASSPYPYVNSNYDLKFQATYSTSDTNNQINSGFIIVSVNNPNTWLWAANDYGTANGSTAGTTVPGNQSWETSGTTYRLQTYAWMSTSNYGNFIGPSTFCYFTIDNTTPNPPVLTSPTVNTDASQGALVNTDGKISTDTGAAGNPAVQMGRAITFTFAAPPAAQHVAGVRWAFGAEPPQPSATSPAGSCTSPSKSGIPIVRYACPSSDGTYAITVDPPGVGSDANLYVQFVNQAGTASLSASVQGGTPHVIAMTVNYSAYGGKSIVSGSDYPTWHSWPTVGTNPGDQGSITHPSSDAPARPNDIAKSLTLTTIGSTATPAANNPASTGTGTYATPNGDAVQFGSNPPTGAHGGTKAMGTVIASDETSTHPGADINWKTGFTVGAWVYTTTYGDNWHHAVLSEEGQNDSLFFLRMSYNGDAGTPSKWQFCVTNDAPSPASVECVDGATVTLNRWTFLTGTWDPTNHEIRIANTDGPTTSTGVDVAAGVATGPLPTAPNNAAAFPLGGALIVGRAQWADFGGDYDAFNGQVAGVFLAPVPMTRDQIIAQRRRSSS